MGVYREALNRLRVLCREILLDFEEGMQSGNPSYSRNGQVEVGFASQKNFGGRYFLRTDVMKAHEGQLQGKSVIRYSRPEKIDFNVVESMLRGTLRSTAPVC